MRPPGAAGGPGRRAAGALALAVLLAGLAVGCSGKLGKGPGDGGGGDGDAGGQDPCARVRCPPSEECRLGLCVRIDPCAGVVCLEEGTRCSYGSCVNAALDEDGDGSPVADDCDDHDPEVRSGSVRPCETSCGDGMSTCANVRKMRTLGKIGVPLVVLGLLAAVTAIPTRSAQAQDQSTRVCGQSASGRSVCIDANASRVNFGCRGRACALTTGFTPDPMPFRLSAGGGRDPINVQTLGLRDAEDGSACGRSFITPKPDFRFTFEAGTRFPLLRFYVVTANGADATLLVNTPDARWRCNDDSYDGRMPTIDFHNPPAGRFDVWVGTYDASRRNPAQFFVTELDSNHP